jgi:hypothetical protein
MEGCWTKFPPAQWEKSVAARCYISQRQIVFNILKAAVVGVLAEQEDVDTRLARVLAHEQAVGHLARRKYHVTRSNE